MVSIFTHRDERKLFAVIGAVVVAALIVLVQVESLRSGRTSPFTAGVAALAGAVQSGVAATLNGAGSVASSLGDLPHLREQNERLAAQNRALADENARLREALAQQPDLLAQARAAENNPGAIAARTIGYDPENQLRAATLDRGSLAGVHADDGVITSDGVVGRIVALQPLEATVLLLTDPTSKIPAVVQRGRWWGIATGTGTAVRLEFVSQDAKLEVGDEVVTGDGRSFRAGIPIGRIVSVQHPEGALYQSALLQPAVALGRLSNTLVLPH